MALGSTAAGAGGAKAALQDLFLAASARDQERMTLFLVNGVMLQGTITGFDYPGAAAIATNDVA